MMGTPQATDVARVPERAIKTLLLTDLVDSTALVDTVGDDRSAELFERHDRIARDLLVKYHGIEIDKTDGFLLIFDRPIDATLYALALHDALAELSTESRVKLAARAGIHLGEVVLRKNRSEDVARGAKPLEVEGHAKPMAARIMSLAQEAQTLMSRSAFDLARRAAVGRPQMPEDINWIDHGVFQFKGIAEAQPVYEVGRTGRAPLTPPPNSEKAWRVTSRDQVAPVGWRPIGGVPVPGRKGWILKRKIGEGHLGGLWIARKKETVSSEDATIGFDKSSNDMATPEERAFLLCQEHGGKTTNDGLPAWQVGGPITCVVITSGDQKGVYALLTKQPLCCGRDLTMDLQINDPKVSRRHFSIHRVEADYVIRELRTKNGVFVNGIRISLEQRLRTADEISVGRTDLVFYQDGGRAITI